MNLKIIFSLFTILGINIINGQQLDLNNIRINDVKNLLGNVLGKEEKYEPLSRAAYLKKKQKKKK